MTIIELDAAVQRVRDAMDVMSVPMFLLSVDRDGSMRFVGINKATELDTGLSSDALAGCTPHEALPERMADTVIANYRQCLIRKARFCYEEVLDVPSGTKHARTTLSPIFGTAHGDAARVVGIVGMSSDITSQKMELRRYIDGTANLRRQCEDTYSEAVAMAERLRGPLALVATLARTARTEVGPRVDPSSSTATDLIITAAEDAIGMIDSIGQTTASARGPIPQSPIDFGHLVRDELALADPEARLSVAYPRLKVIGDAGLTENILHRCFELVRMDASTFVRVTLVPHTMDIHALRLRIAFDTKLSGETSLARSDALRTLENLVASNGHAMDVFWDAEHLETTIEMTVPGRLMHRDPTVACRTRPEGLTAPSPFGRAFTTSAPTRVSDGAAVCRLDACPPPLMRPAPRALEAPRKRAP